MGTPVDKRKHILAIVKAGVEVIPFVGGPLASLIGDYIPTSTEMRVQAALSQLGERLQVLEHRIDVGSVDKEDFAELFKSSYLQLLRSHHKERTEATLGLLVNLLLAPGDPSKLSYTELDHFSRCIDLLSRGALEMLIAVEGLTSESSKMADLMARYPEADESLLYGLAQELTAVNLVEQPPMRVGSPEVERQILRLTPLGHRFLSHVVRLGQKDQCS